MYCSNCGAKAEGNFCASCGAPLAGRANAPAAPGARANAVDESSAALFDPALVARSPEVRELVARYAAHAQKRASGEEFLKAFDKPFTALAGIPIAPIATIAQSISARLGIKMGKERVVTIGRPARDAFLALLCSLARNGQLVRALHTGTDGCVVEAVLPSDMWAFEGTILVTLRSTDPGTEVRASTVIKGQLFDWGKSNACLDALLTDMRNIPVTV